MHVTQLSMRLVFLTIALNVKFPFGSVLTCTVPYHLPNISKASVLTRPVDANKNCFSEQLLGERENNMNPMTFWVVRHAEREDNINSAWQKGSTLKSDNSPLSKRGQGQANELAARFDNIHLDHIFVSPFDRTLETATRLLRGHKNATIKVEPGLCEGLYMCEDPPGYESLDVLKEKYPLVDTSYESVMPWKLPREGYGDEACTARVKITLEGIEKRFPGTEVLLVSHGAPIGAIHELLGGSWKYVGQATVSKFVRKSKGGYIKELTGDASHLSDKTNLRPW